MGGWARHLDNVCAHSYRALTDQDNLCATKSRAEIEWVTLLVYETDAREVQTADCVRLGSWADPFGDVVTPAKACRKELALGFTTCLRKPHKCQRYGSVRHCDGFKYWAAELGLLG